MLSDPMMMPLVVAIAFMSVAAIGWVLTPPAGEAKSKKRVQSVATRARVRGKRQTSAVDQASLRRKQVQETLKELENRQRSARKRSLTLKARIGQAGFTFSTRSFWIACIIIAACVAALGFVTGRPPLITAALALGFGFGGPHWFLGMARGGRMKKFSREFANAIDVIVRGVKSGLPLNECLKIIARESPEPVASEFAKLVEGQAVGISIEDGLRKMYERMPLAEVNFFSVVLAIQQKTGGNLAEALSNLSGVLRSRKMMREKIKAMSSEATASASIIGSLPPGVGLIVFATTPSYMSLMFSEDMGRIMLAGGGIWMGIGIFTMRAMINFKI